LICKNAQVGRPAGPKASGHRRTRHRGASGPAGTEPGDIIKDLSA
jgi:hypothetical protein